MKFSILNTLKMGISILTLASAAYVQAADINVGDSTKLIEGDFQASIALVPHWLEEKLKKDCFVTRPVIHSINEWQFNAIYLKAGIETLAKNTAGNEFSVVTANLSRNASNINDFVQGAPKGCSVNSSFETLDFLITLQNALLFDYTVAYIDQNLNEVALLNQLLIETNNEIYLFLLRKFSPNNERLLIPDPLQVALAGYLDSLLVEIQAFVEAINFGTGEFVPAYDAYRASLDYAEEVGRLIGKAVAYSD
jgi:hypothetical protein